MSEIWNHWEGFIVDGKYKLVRFLGGSGHSAVYLTETGEPQTSKAAIKLLAADASRAELQMSRWKIAAKLSHPGLQPIFDMGRCQVEGRDLLYVVMEVAEEDLSQILPQRALTAEEAKEMLRSVLDAVQYLHEKRLVHTRIKPSNILALDDKIKISSDQICPAGDATMPQETKSLYAAPEDVAGIAVPSSDVWSLGVTLVEVLTQHHPSWRQSTAGELELAEQLPNPYQEIVRHALVRETSRRWKILDFKAELYPPQRKPLPEWPSETVTFSPEPARSAKKRHLEPPSIPAKPRSRKQGLPFSPLWILIPGLAGFAFFVAWLSLNRAVPHQTEAPAPSSAAAEAAALPTSPPGSFPDKGLIKSAPAHEGRSVKKHEKTDSPRPAKLIAEASKEAPKEPVTEAKDESGKGQVLDQVLPDVSERALSTIHGTVRVSVRVQADAAGRVTNAQLDSQGPSEFFAGKALEAAKRWEFISPEAGGRSAPSEWILRFEFRQSGAKAYAKQTSP
ncbi:MAG TPA: protein kinase [Terriglobales bacterium]|nr:protein kinase [Terriglobales bacterium]